MRGPEGRGVEVVVNIVENQGPLFTRYASYSMPIEPLVSSTVIKTASDSSVANTSSQSCELKVFAAQ